MQQINFINLNFRCKFHIAISYKVFKKDVYWNLINEDGKSGIYITFAVGDFNTIKIKNLISFMMTHKSVS